MGIPEQYWIGVVFAVGLAVLGWALLGPQGLREVRGLRAEGQELASEIVRLEEEKATLEKSALRLRESPRAIESKARTDLGMIREGETVFLLPERNGPDH